MWGRILINHPMSTYSNFIKFNTAQSCRKRGRPGKTWLESTSMHYIMKFVDQPMNTEEWRLISGRQRQCWDTKIHNLIKRINIIGIEDNLIIFVKCRNSEAVTSFPNQIHNSLLLAGAVLYVCVCVCVCLCVCVCVWTCLVTQMCFEVGTFLFINCHVIPILTLFDMEDVLSWTKIPNFFVYLKPYTSHW